MKKLILVVYVIGLLNLIITCNSNNDNEPKSQKTAGHQNHNSSKITKQTSSNLIQDIKQQNIKIFIDLICWQDDNLWLAINLNTGGQEIEIRNTDITIIGKKGILYPCSGFCPSFYWHPPLQYQLYLFSHISLMTGNIDIKDKKERLLRNIEVHDYLFTNIWVSRKLGKGTYYGKTDYFGSIPGKSINSIFFVFLGVPKDIGKSELKFRDFKSIKFNPENALEINIADFL